MSTIANQIRQRVLCKLVTWNGLLLCDLEIISKNDLFLARDKTPGIPIVRPAKVLTLGRVEFGRSVRLLGISGSFCGTSTGRSRLGDSTVVDVTIASSSVPSPELALPLIVRLSTACHNEQDESQKKEGTEMQAHQFLSCCGGMNVERRKVLFFLNSS